MELNLVFLMCPMLPFPQRDVTRLYSGLESLLPQWIQLTATSQPSRLDANLPGDQHRFDGWRNNSSATSCI
jgi:hypothetical protein